MGSLVWRMFVDDMEEGDGGPSGGNGRGEEEEDDSGGMEAGGNEANMPKELNTKNTGSFLEISRDKCTVRYTGHGSHDNDVGSVQADTCVPSNLPVYYFETKIVDGGEKCCVGIGFTDKKFKVTRQPGWEPNSYGYHGDDGKKFHNNGLGENYGPTFNTGDVIGAGILLEKQEIFYTKNGKYLGVAFRNVSLPLYPTIGLHSMNECVQVDFVGEKGFVFDPTTLVAQVEENIKQAVESVPLSVAMTHQLVRKYLQHYGYARTLRAFDDLSGANNLSKEVDGAESTASAVKRTKLSYAEKLRSSSKRAQEQSSSASQDPLDTSLELRSAVRAHILNGRPEEAEALLQEKLPQMFEEKNRSICMLVKATLACQSFIRMMQEGRITDAVKYAQDVLVEYRDISKGFDEKIQDVLALLAYHNMSESPVAHLLSCQHTDSVADVINRAVLYLMGEHTISELEVDLRQLLLVQWEIRNVNGSQGKVFNLDEALQGI